MSMRVATLLLPRAAAAARAAVLFTPQYPAPTTRPLGIKSIHTVGLRRCAGGEHAYVAHEVEAVRDVPHPLCRRPATHVEPLTALLDWRHDVLARVSELQSTWEDADGGPAAAELARELGWALDDAVTAWREAEAQPWLPCSSWTALDLELQSAQRRSSQTDAWQVLLRAPLVQLRELWRLRLEERVPFQYLLHAAHWRDLVLAVGPGVLIPRPETEGLIDLAAAAMNASPGLASAPWADLGTGSGALAVALARLLEDRQRPATGMQQQSGLPAVQQQQLQQQPRVWAVDLSPAAVAYATANAAAHGVQDAVRVVHGSWLEPLAQQQQQQQQRKGWLGGILSNPPYIPQVQMAGLQAEVGLHEPHTALDGGPGPGLDSLQPICEQAAAALLPGGFIALETAGPEQAPLVAALLAAQTVPGEADGPAFADVQTHADCFGVTRLVSAWRRGAS